MAYNFPNSPSNGDTVVVNGVTYEYNSTDNAWKTGTGVGPAITSDGSTPSLASGITAAEIRTLIDSPDLSSVDTDIIPDGDGTRDLGSSTAKWKDLYLSGNTLYLGSQTLESDSSSIILSQLKIGSGSNQVTLSGGANGTLQTGGSPVFSGAFADLTGKPTTVAGYGITDGATQSYVTTQINNVIDSAPGALNTLNELAAALGDDANFSTTVTNNLALKAPLASPSLTGTPTAPTATTGNNTTQIATTAFVQSAVSGAGSYNDASVDTHLNRTTAATGEVLSWNGSDYDWVARTTFSTLSGKPTTLSGYGITDGATIDSPAFTGTPTAPTASGGTNSTQIATTAYVQGEISSFSGGDSQIEFTANGAIAEGKAVILSSTAGQVEEVSQVAVAGTHTTAVSSSNSTTYRYQAAPLDYNDQDSVYQQFWYDGSNLVGSVWSTNLGTLTLSSGTGQSLIGGVTPDNYFHIKGTSTGILRAGTNSYIVTNSSGTLSIGSANAVGTYSKIVTTGNGDLIALNGSDCYFVTVSGTTISFGSAIAIGLTPTYQAFEWSPTYNKLVAATISSGTITYTTGTVSGSNITWASVSTESSWGSTSTDIAFHVGVERLIGFRRHFIGSSSPTTVKFRSSSFNGSAFAFSSSTETTLLGPSNTNPSAAYYYLSPYIKCSKTDGGFGIFTKYEYNSTDRYLGNLTSGGVFSLEVGGSRVVTREYGTNLSYRPGGENDPAGYLSMGTSSGQTYPSNNSSVHAVFFRTSAVSTKDSYLGIAQSTVSSGATVTVMLGGGISTRHTSLTPDTKMYVQNDGTITSTVSTVVAGTAINATSIQVADGRGTFDKAVSFTTLSDKPTTIAGYGITDAISSAGDVDIGSSDFITTGKSYYANMFATTGDLPSATTYHGMFAHVHGTGAGYFAHAGNWVELANKSYVDTEVANIVNSAPATLDTLDELAAALNDDANFATTVTTSLGLKAPLASPALTGTPTAPTAASGTNTTQIATTAFVQAAVGSSSSSPLSISYAPEVKYARLELTANQSISAATSTVVNFNTRSVDSSTNNLLTSTLGSGKFIIPAGVSKVRFKASARTSSVTDQVILKIIKNGSNAVTTNFDIDSTGSDFPAVFTGIESVTQGDYFQVSVFSQNARTVETGDFTWFELEVLEGSILNQTVTGNVSIDDLSDVDTTTSAPTDGQALVWNNTASEWRPGTVATSGGASVTTSDAAPSSPSAGDLWYNTDAGGLFLYYTDADSSQWVEVVGKTGPAGPTGAAGGSTITVSDAAPSSPVAGQLWWNSTSNKLYIYYTDANSSQWVQATTPGATGATGATGADGATPGRNRFINGNFDVWQRGTSATASGFAADRWRLGIVGNSQCTFSQQSFTLGQTDVPFNPRFYQRAVVTAGSDANSYVLFNQRIEDVRTFQGETVTVSFWAKADAAKDFALEPYQMFGTGGSPSAAVPITPQTVTLSTTWTKYTKTFNIPSITGKNLGTDPNSSWLGFFFWLDAGSNWNTRAALLGNQSGTFDFAQIQVETGSTATDFETEALGITVEKCQRYFVTLGVAGSGYATGANQTASAVATVTLPTRMRAVPTVTANITQGALTNTGAALTPFNFYNTGGGLGATSTGSGRQWWGALAEFNAET